ncbi:hypothetical protein [Elizabethkingia anophelis]|uniref:hypothetical protein n=1 Tax=Elizabethkingia anophelis TaxID=1117645 RepID=UPI0021A967D5|nr:hypothetical protein [Elizabethkingia anophelis]
MKTKYIAVPVSERLPERGKNIIFLWNDHPEIIAKGTISKFGNLIVHGNVDYEGKPDLYLEEVPDHSEEMLSVLSEVMRFKHELRMIMSEKLQYPDNFLKALNDAEQLINKINNGKNEGRNHR